MDETEKSILIENLKNELSPERFAHSVSTAKEAVSLGAKWGADIKKCEIAGLLHDCGKKKYENGEITECEKYKIILNDDDLKCPYILHSYLSREIARDKYKIADPKILDAIGNHTLGGHNMGLIEKIIFTADFIEPGRKGDIFQKIRKKAYEDLDEAMLMIYDQKINYSKERGNHVHKRAVENREELNKSLKERN